MGNCYAEQFPKLWLSVNKGVSKTPIKHVDD